MTIRFFYNGVKASDGKLQKASVYTSQDGSIIISKRDYRGFCAEVLDAFAVTDNTDTMTDYFDHARFIIRSGHPMYAAAKAAADKNVQRFEAQQRKRMARYSTAA
jgi:hypothetical protein